SLRELDYVQAARALGRRDVGVAFRHILPNCMAPLLVQGTFIFAYAVLAEAILGFLGVGVPPYVPSWGNVIASGKNVIREAFWVSAFPGLALTLAGLSLNLLGDGLRDTLDPRLRRASARSSASTPGLPRRCTIATPTATASSCKSTTSPAPRKARPGCTRRRSTRTRSVWSTIPTPW